MNGTKQSIQKYIYIYIVPSGDKIATKIGLIHAKDEEKMKKDVSFAFIFN